MKKTTIGGLAVAVVLGFAPAAPAKTVKAFISVGSQPTGTTFTTSNGSAVWAQANGFNSVGVMTCVARGYVNKVWTTAGSCDAAAVKHNAQLRSLGSTFCTSAQVAWNSKQLCWVDNLLPSPNGGALVNVGTVLAYSDTAL